VAAGLRRRPPHRNTTPEGRLAGHRARARDIGFPHSMDGVIVRTIGACARVPRILQALERAKVIKMERVSEAQDGYLSMIVAAGRSSGLQSPPVDGIKHGFV